MKKEKLKLKNFKFCFIFLSFIIYALSLAPLNVQSAEPTLPYFQLRVSHSTGGDNTGDGGAGNPVDYNYYFVGQIFEAKIQMHTNNINTVSANVIIYYDPNFLEVQDALPGPGIQIKPGALYETYPSTGNTVDTTNGIIRLTGYSASSVYNSGASEGTFGTITFKVIQQKTATQGVTTDPAFVDIEFLGIGVTTDSNINDETAQDILQSVEDSYWHLWPDTTKPYIDTFNPVDGAINVSVAQNLTFYFKDNETGVNTSTLKIKVKKERSGWQDYTSYASFSCSGLWETNDCLVTINPPGIRNWDYYTEYKVRLRDGKDKASSFQNPVGHNKMDGFEYSFTTEPDIWAPYVRNHSPAKNATGVPTNTNVSFEIVDIEGGVTGTGVNLSTVKVRVKTEEFCQSGCQGDFLSVIPLNLGGFTYGYQITVDLAGDFEENEIVNVSIYEATDNDNVLPEPTPNVMTSDNYIFTTIDTRGPYFADHFPSKGAYFSDAGQNVSFHIKDDGRGVDIDTVSVQIGEIIYTRTDPKFSYSGDSSDYYIEVEPSDFTGNQAVPIILRASDLKASPVNSSEDLYAIFYLKDSDCPSCPGCPPCYCSGCLPCPACPEKGICPSCPQIICPEKGFCPSCPPGEEIACPPCPQIICPEEGICPPCPEYPACPEFPGIEEYIIRIPPGPPSLPSVTSLRINEQPMVLGGTAYVDKEYVIFGGEATPEAEIILEIYSNFLLLKTLSDKEGRWRTKTKASLLGEGEHIVFGRVIKGNQKSERITLAKMVIKPEVLRVKVCWEEKIINWWQGLSLWQKILILLVIILIVFGVIKIVLRKKV